jgi:hypothetical protein
MCEVSYINETIFFDDEKWIVYLIVIHEKVQTLHSTYNHADMRANGSEC